jgi:hypothetical protein
MANIPAPGQLIGRALTNIGSETPDSTFSLLQNQTADAFISRVMAIGGMLAVATQQKVTGPGKIISILDIAEGQMVGGLGEWETVAEEDYATTDYSGTYLHPKPYELAYPYNRSLDQLSIIGPAMEGTVDSMMQTAIHNEFERICLLSDTGGSDGSYAPGNMTTIDGWWVKAQGGHVYDYEGSYISPLIFEGAYARMPYKYRGNPVRKADMTFWVNDQAVINYRSLLSRVPNGLGSLSLTEANDVTFAGITIKENAYMGTNLPGLLSETDGGSVFTGALLVENKNLVFGYGPAMRLTKTVDKSGKFIWYYWVGSADVGYMDVDSVVAVVNINPALNPSLPIFAGLS